MRVLTGPRWRFGGRDISALWRRAVDLDEVGRAPGDRASADAIVAQSAPDADTPCLADAISDPGAVHAYSPEGYRRITALGHELTGLRAHLAHPLPELVAEVRRVLGVDAEARAARPPSAGWSGTEHLDAFADVVADYAAARPGAAVSDLLAFLDAAAVVENGLAPRWGHHPRSGGVTVAHDRVQILTVHAAKGLEWQVVAVPHLSGRVFPSTASMRTWLTDAADLPPLLRGDRATLGLHGVPVLDTSDVNDRKRLSDKISEHKRRLDQRRVDEERRLLYVALTRAEDTLLLSGHHWGASETKPRGPSEFLCELKEIIDGSAAEIIDGSAVVGDPCGVVEHWAPAPADGDPNPLRDKVVEAIWPADPAGARRGDVDRGAALVRSAMTGRLEAPEDDVDDWAADVDALLAERDRVPPERAATLPAALSVSCLVELGRDPDAAMRRLRRRLPVRPDPHALLGTAFHDWVQRFYGAERLFDLDDLPGAVDGQLARADAEGLAELQAAFMASPWAARTPVDIEVPFDMVIGDTVVRGRIDAVFEDADGATVVDWKTGEPPATPEANRHAAVQLAVYRVAWAALRGVPAASVRAAFHYVRSGQTVTPESLPEARGSGRAARVTRGLGAAVDLDRLRDHRNLQRQPGDRGQPHRPRLVPPQPHMVEVSGEHADEKGDRGQCAQLPGARHQQQRAGAQLRDAGGVGVEPRATRQLRRNDAVERLGRKEMQCAYTEQHGPHAFGGGGVGDLLQFGHRRGHDYIMACEPCRER